MHLVRTGAFLRALRSTRLANPQISLRKATRYERCFITTPSHLSSPAAFPEQSVDTLDEVDPRKTEAASANSSEEDNKSRFQRILREKEDNVIIKDTQSPLSGAKILQSPYVFDVTSNVTNAILNLVGRELYKNPNHPIAITRKLIESAFCHPTYENLTVPNPIVSTHDNFDVLGFPEDHPGRSRTDTYYVDSKTVLRTHTSAHQHVAFKRLDAKEKGGNTKRSTGYTICADVYRRDSIDRSHFPVFHQMEGARTWKLFQSRTVEDSKRRIQQQDSRMDTIRRQITFIKTGEFEVLDEGGHYNDKSNPIQVQHEPEEAKLVAEHLKRSLEKLVYSIYEAAKAGDPTGKHSPLKVRWVEAYFPFTSPSFELEVFWQGEWLELLGCGVVKQEILNNAGLNDRIGWAWGLGIERLAMLLFNIPDIRLFWSEDPRFLNQFKAGQITRFKPFSKYPASPRDISFWVNPSPGLASPVGAETSSGVAAAAGGDATKASPAETQPAAFHENDLMEVVRDVAGTIVEDVKLVDEFVHPTKQKKSLCYRVIYRSNEKTLTNEEVNALHEKLLEKLKDLPIEIRE